jgi:hypothetical protein
MFTELEAAGFQRGPGARPALQPGSAPLSELVVDADVSGVPLETLAGAVFIVLRNSGGSIVATWSEGRWWTPEESDTYSDARGVESEHKQRVGSYPT